MHTCRVQSIALQSIISPSLHNKSPTSGSCNAEFLPNKNLRCSRVQNLNQCGYVVGTRCKMTIEILLYVIHYRVEAISGIPSLPSLSNTSQVDWEKWTITGCTKESVDDSEWHQSKFSKDFPVLPLRVQRSFIRTSSSTLFIQRLQPVPPRNSAQNNTTHKSNGGHNHKTRVIHFQEDRRVTYKQRLINTLSTRPNLGLVIGGGPILRRLSLEIDATVTASA
ncbi:hypothetical protein TNCT_107621 [Trichonephila clavata]|uniref:Uncharacterized protein n=1 Tax=Trichonephila clavata TaxID=2740835 RepID=A0A8X6G3R7_TRICU|nr:hypothetical protein TNCT_107621 [Trichonephila clavata]